MDFLSLFAMLVFAHALADYPLQGDFLARAKNHTAPIPGVPWWQALGAHAIIHGGFVACITGSLVLGLAEVIAHAMIDRAKCAGRLTFNADQGLHILCKLWWTGAALFPTLFA